MLFHGHSEKIREELRITEIIGDCNNREVEESIKIIYHECEGGIEKLVTRITVWHRKTCRVMTNGDAREGFSYPILIRMLGSFFLLTIKYRILC